MNVFVLKSHIFGRMTDEVFINMYCGIQLTFFVGLFPDSVTEFKDFETAVL
jgi:hypothetical protein